MQRIHLIAIGVALVLSTAGFYGCDGSGAGGGDGSDATAGRETAGHEHEHSHEGVHGGQVIELGDENYHAELVHDDATHKVGVYLLDGTAEVAAPIDAPSITLNCCTVGDNPAQYTLEAVPQAGDPPGSASYFELTDEALCEGIDAPGAVARLNISIGGKSYVGQIETNTHDHAADHDHGHE